MRALIGSVAAAMFLGAAAPAPAPPEAPEAVLLGRAILSATAYQPGPPSGATIRGSNGVVPPLPGQALPGFSALLDAGDGALWGMPDNGFGIKAKSADFLLRLYLIKPDFRTAQGGSGGVRILRFLQLSDPEGRIPFQLTRPDRLLTGADFDPESVRRLPDGSFWIGDEYGPFLLHVDAAGKVLSAPVPMPGVVSPNYPGLTDPSLATLDGSRGFEAMALDPGGRYLYPMVEGRLRGDPVPERRLMREFDTTTGQYTERRWTYLVDRPGALVGDLTALDANRFVLIERDAGQGPAARHKKIYLIDFRVRDEQGNLAKQPVVDLLQIADPSGISSPARPDEFGVGRTFTFPLASVESLEVLSGGLLLVANDNNFPNDNGRWIGRNRPDDVELIVLRTWLSAGPAAGPNPAEGAAGSAAAGRSPAPESVAPAPAATPAVSATAGDRASVR